MKLVITTNIGQTGINEKCASLYTNFVHTKILKHMQKAIIITEEEINEIVKKAVIEAFEERNAQSQALNNQPPFLTGKKLQEMTGWSSRTLQHLRDTRQIPFTQHGRKILYPTQDLIQALNKFKIESKG